jgi:hypothetical protein
MDIIKFNPDEEHGILSWSSNTNTFSAEISELEHNLNISPRMMRGSQVTVQNTKNNKKIVFEFLTTDYYGSGENREIGGWRFKAFSGHTKYCELLIIND